MHVQVLGGADTSLQQPVQLWVVIDECKLNKECRHTSVALAVYHTPPSESVVDLAYFISILSRSLPSIATAPRKGTRSADRQRGRVRKRSAKSWVAVTGRADTGK